MTKEIKGKLKEEIGYAFRYATRMAKLTTWDKEPRFKYRLTLSVLAVSFAGMAITNALEPIDVGDGPVDYIFTEAPIEEIMQHDPMSLAVTPLNYILEADLDNEQPGQ